MKKPVTGQVSIWRLCEIQEIVIMHQRIEDGIRHIRTELIGNARADNTKNPGIEQSRFWGTSCSSL
jgi:hypothetical protein